MAQNRLLLLDAMALIYRAHFAFIRAPRLTSTGKNTSAIFGFINSLLDARKKLKPTHIAVGFESKGLTFRHELFPEYKAQREETPEDIVFAVPYVIKMLEALRIPALSVEGFEADDVIGTLALKAHDAGFEVYMMTSDKDYAQLVRPGIYLYRPGGNKNPDETLDPQGVFEKFGVTPEQIPDFLALVGDTVDNIPGIPKVGEKTAAELLRMYGNLERVLAAAPTITKPALKANLLEYGDRARKSRHLATIHTDVPVAFDPSSLELEPPDRSLLVPLINELEFRTLGARLLADDQPNGTELFAPKSPAPAAITHEDAEAITPMQPLLTLADVPHTYHIAQTEAEHNILLAKLLATEAFSFDTETTGLDALTSEIVGLSFCITAGEAWYVPCPPDFQAAKELVARFKPAFSHAGITKIGQNIKYDMLVLHKYGIEVLGALFDTMLAHYVCHAGARHNMDVLAQQYLHYKPIPISDLIGAKGKKQLSMRDVPLEVITDYAAEDADVTLRLVEPLQTEMRRLDVESVFKTIEAPLVPVLCSMEIRGIKIDHHFLNDYSIELHKEMSVLEADIHSLSGENFNVNSPKQLGEILFDKLKLGGTEAKKTKTGQYSTDEETLATLAAAGHALPEKILLYRELAKLKSTYVDALPQLVNAKTGRVHTSFNQAVAVTGRLSSNNPNLQNIPIRTDRGKEVRRAFISEAGNVLLAADYSQIELRIMASLSEDTALCEAFRSGRDIHTETAARVFGVQADAVTGEMRRRAKMVNFGIIYGISAFGLAQRLGITRSEAKTIIDAYFSQYPRVKHFMDSCIADARQHGYARTLTGRRHALPDIHSQNNTVRGFAERNAINTPIQGTAADMIKLAMINLHRRLKGTEFDNTMILQVHDELLFEVPEQRAEALKAIVIEEMANALPLNVPVECSAGIGLNWLDAH